MTDEQKKQFTLRISQANKSGMIIVLYDIFLAYVQDGITYATKDEVMYHTSVKKAKQTIEQLTKSINPKNSLAGNYASLYGFALRQLTKADSSKDTEILRQLQTMVTSLRNAYEEVSKKDTSAPVMGNVQTVYAGLTYGKDHLTENLATTTNRGFLV